MGEEKLDKKLLDQVLEDMVSIGIVNKRGEMYGIPEKTLGMIELMVPAFVLESVRNGGRRAIERLRETSGEDLAITVFSSNTLAHMTLQKIRVGVPQPYVYDADYVKAVIQVCTTLLAIVKDMWPDRYEKLIKTCIKLRDFTLNMISSLEGY